MIPLRRHFLRPLRHPEFTGPGMLCLAVGSAFIGYAWAIQPVAEALWIGGLLLVTGAALLLRTWVGTALFIAVLALCLIDGNGRIEWTGMGVIRLATGLVFVASMVHCVIEQITYLRFRRKHRIAEI
jgi:hypothetical protein